MRLGRRLGSRLVISFGLLFIVSFSLVVSLTLFFASDWLDTAIDDNLHGLSETAAERVLAGTEPERVVEELSSATQFLEYRDADGILRAASSNLETGFVPGFRRPSDNDATVRTTRLERSRVRVVTLPVYEPDDVLQGYLVAAGPVPELSDELRTLTLIIAAAGLGGLLIALGGTLYLARRIARPLTELAEGVRAGAAAGYPAQVAIPTNATVEVEDVGKAIQELVAQQQSRLDREREFFADSSHVLRTPLAVVSGNLELLEASEPGRERDEALAEARRALGTIARRVDGLLLLARGRGQVRPDWEIVNLSALLRDVAGALTRAAPKLRCRVDVPDGLEVAGDVSQLRELFQSVTENAAAYTPAGGDVSIRARGEPEWVVVEVRDTGIGLSEEEARQATTRFFRGHQARRLFPGGSGLGLAIAQQIAELHEGDITIRPAEGGGVLATIRLPRFG